MLEFQIEALPGLERVQVWGVFFLLGLFCIHTSRSVSVFAERRSALVSVTQIVTRHQNATTTEGWHNHFYLMRLQDRARTQLL